MSVQQNATNQINLNNVFYILIKKKKKFFKGFN